MTSHDRVTVGCSHLVTLTVISLLYYIMSSPSEVDGSITVLDSDSGDYASDQVFQPASFGDFTRYILPP